MLSHLGLCISPPKSEKGGQRRHLNKTARLFSDFGRANEKSLGQEVSRHRSCRSCQGSLDTSPCACGPPHCFAEPRRQLCTALPTLPHAKPTHLHTSVSLLCIHSASSGSQIRWARNTHCYSLFSPLTDSFPIQTLFPVPTQDPLLPASTYKQLPLCRSAHTLMIPSWWTAVPCLCADPMTGQGSHHRGANEQMRLGRNGASSNI